MKQKIACVAIAVGMIIFAVILLISPSIDTSQPPKDLSQMSYRDVEKDQIYFVPDLLVADQFAVLNEDEVIYMMVLFEDKDGTVVAANMPVGKSAELRSAVEAYLNDDSQLIGDFAINCYVKVEKDYDVNDELNGLFDESVTELKTLSGWSIKKLGLRMVYVCDEAGDPYATVAGADTVKKVVAAVLFGLAGLLLYFGVIRKPRPKAEP